MPAPQASDVPHCASVSLMVAPNPAAQARLVGFSSAPPLRRSLGAPSWGCWLVPGIREFLLDPYFAASLPLDDCRLPWRAVGETGGWPSPLRASSTARAPAAFAASCCPAQRLPG
eukprot:4352089-Pyramimonas_sp.AAC.1